MNNMSKKLFLSVALALVIFNNVWAQKKTTGYQFDKPLYGAAYYSEYTPTDRLEKDIQLMKQAGLTVVRVGESAWSLFEPQEWTGQPLIYPSEDYDGRYAHKPFVVKHNGVVYHYCCAVDEQRHRTIALAASREMKAP